MPSPDLTQAQCQLVEDLLRQYLPTNTEVWVFGSRTSTHHKPFSDLDLFIKSTTLIDKRKLAHCEYELEESNLPYKVDLIEWSSLTPEFQQTIENSPHFLWFVI